MRKSLLFPLLLSLVFFVFLVVKSEKGMRLDLQAKGDSFIEGIKIVHKKNGAPDWILIARRADISRGGEEAHLHDLTLSMQDRGLTIRAGQGVYDFLKKNIEITGKLTAEGNHLAIATEDVSFDNGSDVLKTDAPVIIEGKKFVLGGTGMKVDTTEQKMRILRNVKATFYH